MSSELTRSPLQRLVVTVLCRFGYDRGLHRCERCRWPFVALVDRERSGMSFWHVWLRCGECGHERETIATNIEMRDFEHELALQREQIAVALKRVERDRMQEELAVLVAAFERDLIDAADFAVRRTVATGPPARG